MKICFHYILHVADSMHDTGPCWATWQYPMKRLCGILQPFTKSRLHPYKNLTNHVHLLELFYNLRFYQRIHEQIFPPVPRKEYEKHMVYSNRDYEEEFYWPSDTHVLNNSELKRIKNYLSVVEDLAAGMQLGVSVIFFKKIFILSNN
jgi:hypothetical protein